MRERIEQNIDQWIFDYLEGKLSASDSSGFEQYLLSNQDCYDEVEKWKSTYLTRPNTSYNLEERLIQKGSWSGKWLWYSLFVIGFIGLSISGVIYFNSDFSTKENIAKEITSEKKEVIQTEIRSSGSNSTYHETKTTQSSESRVSTEIINSNLASPKKEPPNVQILKEEEGVKLSISPKNFSTQPELKHQEQELIEESIKMASAPLEDIDNSSIVDETQDNLGKEYKEVSKIKTDSLQSTSAIKALNQELEKTKSLKEITNSKDEEKPIKPSKKHQKQRFKNFDLHPDNDFIETNDNF